MDTSGVNTEAPSKAIYLEERGLPIKAWKRCNVRHFVVVTALTILIAAGNARAASVDLGMTTSNLAMTDGGDRIEGNVIDVYCKISRKKIPLSSHKIQQNRIRTSSFGDIKLVMGSDFSAHMSIDTKYRDSLSKFCRSN
jgi:hypothetical protein